MFGPKLRVHRDSVEPVEPMPELSDSGSGKSIRLGASSCKLARILKNQEHKRHQNELLVCAIVLVIYHTYNTLASCLHVYLDFTIKSTSAIKTNYCMRYSVTYSTSHQPHLQHT